ncbi:MAG TPA: CADD family putative folate metabolism protein [Acidobacteriaceae bacterium]|nr:CADD family putative folate metabolism protein [Acidobacteriaceae bacterium]
MPTTTEFFLHLEERIAPYDLLKHLFYRAWTAGELTPEDLRDYASEYWHHVSAFPTYLSAMHSRLEDAELRRTVLRNLVDEEGIDSPDGKPHSELWMDFAKGMGAEEGAVRNRQVQPETRNLIGTLHKLMQQDSAALGLAALYAYESRVPEIARQKAVGLRDNYAADAATCRYFTLHQTADVHHAEVWKQAINDELTRDPAAADRALDAAEATAQALWSALDGVERLRMQRMAN